MRKIIFYIVLGFTFKSAVFAQKTSFLNPDPRLYEVFDKKYIEDIASNDTFWLVKNNYYLTHAAFFSEVPNVKEQDIQNMPVVHIKDTTNFNIYLFERDQKIKRDYYTYSVYRVAEYSNLYLVYYPSHDYIENFNRFLIGFRYQESGISPK